MLQENLKAQLERVAASSIAAQAEIAALRDYCATAGFTPVYDPYAPKHENVQRLADARAEPGDDRPLPERMQALGQAFARVASGVPQRVAVPRVAPPVASPSDDVPLLASSGDSTASLLRTKSRSDL